MAKRSNRRSAAVVPKSSLAAPPKEIVLSERWVTLLQAALIIAVGFWVYGPALHGEWLWDDDWYVTDQPLLRHADGLWKFWFQPGSWVEYYPVEETLLWIEWHLFGNDTFGYHLVTVALHLANALLVWRLLGKLGLRLAWIGALIFAVHPVAVDSVAWIVETKNTLSLLPLLLAMCAWVDYAEGKSGRDYAWSLGWFVVAMLCKIEVAPFPVVILLYAWWKHRRVGGSDLVGAAPFFIVALALGTLSLASGSWYYHNIAEIPEPVPELGFMARFALAGQTLGLFFTHCFWPVNLLPGYPQWKVDPSSPLQFLPWPILAIALYALWRKRESWGRHTLLAAGFFLLFLGPFLGFNVASYMNFTWVMDHFLYIPLIGVAGLIAAALESIQARIATSGQFIVTATTAVLVVLLAFEAHAYAVAYTDEATLWGYTVQHNPGSWMAQDNLAKALLTDGQPEEALPHFEAALRLRPNRAQIHLNLGRTLVQMNRVPEGLSEYDRALALNPADPEIYNQKGVALLQTAKFAEALTQFEQALVLCPHYAIAMANAGSALAQSGRLPEAIARFNQALELQPNDVATLDNLGMALMQSGRISEAREKFQQALQLDPKDPRALENLPKLQPLK